jgi:hypothetical protein
MTEAKKPPRYKAKEAIPLAVVVDRLTGAYVFTSISVGECHKEADRLNAAEAEAE